MATKTTTTYEKVLTFGLVSQQWMLKDSNNPKTKLGYAIQKMTGRLAKVQQKYQDLREDILTENAAVDDKGIIQFEKDDKGQPAQVNGQATQQMRYTKDGAKARNKQLRDLFESACEIEPYYATRIPADLTPYEEECFVGFVMKESDVKAEPEEDDAVVGDQGSVASEETVN